MKRTPWFSTEDPPVRKGQYECRCLLGTWLKAGTRMYWTGSKWLPLTGELTSFGHWCDEWRGLTSRTSSQRAQSRWKGER